MQTCRNQVTQQNKVSANYHWNQLQSIVKIMNNQLDVSVVPSIELEFQ